MYWYIIVGYMKLALYKDSDCLGYFPNRETCHAYMDAAKVYAAQRV